MIHLTYRRWTAVVQGGVIYGIEKSRHGKVNYMTASGKSFGVVINDRFEWLIQKGDVVLTQDKREAESSEFSISREDAQDGRMLTVYAYRYNSDDVPSAWKEGSKGTTK